MPERRVNAARQSRAARGGTGGSVTAEDASLSRGIAYMLTCFTIWLLVVVAPWTPLLIAPSRAAGWTCVGLLAFTGVLGGAGIVVLSYATVVPSFWDGKLTPLLHRRATRMMVFCLAISCFLAFFGFAYWMMSHDIKASFYPGAMSKPATAYFTMSIFTTAGLGDIHPSTGLAQFAVTLQMLGGFVLIAATAVVAVSRGLSPSGKWRLGFWGRPIPMSPSSRPIDGGVTDPHRREAGPEAGSR